MRSVLAVLIAAAALAGCSNRDRSNPFDPGNPNTGGRPANFVALAGNGVITLQWTPALNVGLTGYRIERRLEGDDAYLTIAELLPPAARQLSDFKALNDVDHHYRIYYVFPGGPAGTPSEAVAMPGTRRPWVADLAARTVLRLTPDGRRVLTVDRSATGPTAVAVNPLNGIVWVCDTFGDRALVYAPSLPAPIVIEGLSGPNAVAIDAVDRSAWVCDAGMHRVLHFTDAGIAEPPTLSGVLDPVAIAVDPNDRSVWVCEGRGQMLRRFEAGGSPLWGAPVVSPSRLALDPATRVAWVTSFDRAQVVRIAQNGAPIDILSDFRGPIGIAIDADRDRIWIADGRAGEVVALRRNASVEFRIRGLSGVTEIAVDASTGEAWVTLPSLGQVARLSPENGGRIVRILSGLEEPHGIAIDPGVR